jgi:hypothetical protein
MKAAAVLVGMSWMWTLALSTTRPHADARLRADARGRDGGVREELAAERGPLSRSRGRASACASSTADPIRPAIFRFERFRAH